MQTKDTNPSLSVDHATHQAAILEREEKLNEVLRNMSEMAQKLSELSNSYQRAETENTILREKIQLLQQQLYGRKSERLPTGIDDGFAQTSLFEYVGSDDVNAPEPQTVKEIIEVPAHRRKKRGRKPIPADLPRKDIVYDLPEEEKQCNCGCLKSYIGEEVSEKLEMTPASFWVSRTIRLKYVCKGCEGVESGGDVPTVKIASAPPQFLPKTIASPSLLSHIIVSKFYNSLPFYRQEKNFKHLGLTLSRATMCNWALKTAGRLTDLVKLLHKEILSGPLINMDETTLQVLREQGRDPDNKSYMWVIRGGPPGKEGILYIYNESRGGKVASDILGDYRGCVQTDGHSGYNFLDSRVGITHAGCWAHVRRKFFDVLKADGLKGKPKSLKGLGKAGEALQFIRDLYKVENEAQKHGLSAELLYQERQEKSKLTVDAFESWLKELAPKVAPNLLLGKAIRYTMGQWARLIKFLDNAAVGLDNNWAENAIRPFVVGRKNWLFFDQPDGAEAGAILYSLVETAKLNALEPYRYFCYIIDQLPHLAEDDEIGLKGLLPQYLDQQILEEHQSEYRKRGDVK